MTLWVYVCVVFRGCQLANQGKAIYTSVMLMESYLVPMASSPPHTHPISPHRLHCCHASPPNNSPLPHCATARVPLWTRDLLITQVSRPNPEFSTVNFHVCRVRMGQMWESGEEHLKTIVTLKCLLFNWLMTLVQQALQLTAGVDNVLCWLFLA